MSPEVSLVIPTHNGAAYLADTIRSVLLQSYTDWELVIVDDGSRDGTPEVISGFSRGDERIRWITQSQSGIAAARNAGYRASHASSTYLLFLDHDDLLEPGCLATLRAALLAKPRAPAAHGLACYIGPIGQLVKPGELEMFGRNRRSIVEGRVVDWPLAAPTTFGVLAYSCFISTVGQVLIRRSALAVCGGFDSAVEPCDDWDLWLRLSKRGEFVFCNRLVTRWRQHDRNTSSDTEAMQMAYLRVLWKTCCSESLTIEQRGVLLGVLSAVQDQVCKRLDRMELSGTHVETVRAAVVHAVSAVTELLRMEERAPELKEEANQAVAAAGSSYQAALVNWQRQGSERQEL